jgi:hypothetical protein
LHLALKCRCSNMYDVRGLMYDERRNKKSEMRNQRTCGDE